MTWTSARCQLAPLLLQYCIKQEQESVLYVVQANADPYDVFGALQ